MTNFADGIQSGLSALTSGASSFSPVVLERSFSFSGGSSTIGFVFPPNTVNVDAKLYITANGSAATTDKITVSAAGTNLLSFTSFGSATGLVKVTTAGLGTYTPIASAMVSLGNTDIVSAAATLLSVDTAATYKLQLVFNVARNVQ